MRKVKHFAGYGTVMMGKVNDGTARLHVRVEGNHEQGIAVPEWDEYRLFQWTVGRFVRGMTFEQWHRLRPVVDIQEDFRDDAKTGYIDICDYYFYF